MWRLLLGTMGVKSLVQGLNAAATAGFEPRTVWSEVRRRNRLATAPPWASWASSPVKLQEQDKRSRIRVLEDDKISAATNWVSIWEWNLKLVFLIFPWGSWMGLVRITSWYPNFNGSHFGLPPSSINRMTGLGGKIAWTDVFAQGPSVTANKVRRASYDCHYILHANDNFCRLS